MNTIRAHLTASHLVLACIVLLLVSILFSSLVRTYLLNEARETLTVQGSTMASLFATEILLRGVRSPMFFDERLRVWSRAVSSMINADFVVISAAGEMLVPSEDIHLPEAPEERLDMVPIRRALETGEIQGDEWRTPDGDPLVAVFVPIEIQEEIPPVGVVILFQTVTAATTAARDLRHMILQTGAVALVLALILSLIFAQRISRPAEELSDVARALGRGELDRRAPEGYVWEFSQLSRRINEMAHQLSEFLARRRAFTAAISHEIRTPVTSIRGFVRAIRDGVISPEDQEQYLDTILDETRRIERLLEDLLQLERLEARQLSMQFEWIPARQLLKRATSRAATRVEAGDIQLKSVVDEGLMVWADEERVDQVLGNLVDNALRYATGCLQLGVRVEEEEGQRRTAVFWVADDGPGIAEEDLPHIFDRFYQASDKVSKGVGLGLAISREIIHLHGGRIWVENRRGGGAVLYFTLPNTRKVVDERS